jgi:hypothetical protein
MDESIVCMNEWKMDGWMGGWVGLNTNLYNDLVGEPEPSIWGLSFLVSSIKKGWLGLVKLVLQEE